MIARGTFLRGLAASSALAGASAAAALAQQAPAPIPIVVAPIGSTDMTPFFYALRQGMFAKAGLDVTVTQAPSGAASTTAVVGGAAQIGFTNLLALSIAYERGIAVDLIAPGVQYDTAAPNVLLLVAADGPVHSAKDLEGRVVAVTGLHDLLAVATTAWIARAGADPAKVRYVEMPPSSMAGALAAQHVDAVAVYDPFMGAIVASGARVLGKPYDALGAPFVNAAWFALRPWADAHHDAALRFAEVIRRAAAYTNPHYDALIPLISSFSKIPPETLAKMVHVRVPTTFTAAQVQPVVDLAAKEHEIPNAFHAREMMLAGLP